MQNLQTVHADWQSAFVFISSGFRFVFKANCKGNLFALNSQVSSRYSVIQYLYIRIGLAIGVLVLQGRKSWTYIAGVISLENSEIWYRHFHTKHTPFISFRQCFQQQTCLQISCCNICAALKLFLNWNSEFHKHFSSRSGVTNVMALLTFSPLS